MKQGKSARMSKCLYPSCKKKVYGTALDASLPLCKEHIVLTQWISYILHKKKVLMAEIEDSKGKARD